jgi:hypothetical protein
MRDRESLPLVRAFIQEGLASGLLDRIDPIAIHFLEGPVERES